MTQERVCKTCGVVFVGGPRAYYCPDCRALRREESTKQSHQRQALGVQRKLGSFDTCNICGDIYMVASANQRYCTSCGKAHLMALQRTRGLARYHANKAVINPKRYAKRRRKTANKRNDAPPGI